ncbi:coil containing protein [Vibrio phage 1.250.O._10N.261.55.E11]|nr:coil containing protein [Vibrio phage 1.250.O._10N.261.55.E11]
MGNEAKFTQGPWVARGSTPSRIYGMQRADKEVIIAATGSVLENSGANAHLIATAPEMYAEIERDVLEIEARLKFADKRTLAVNPDVANLKRKKALLAKARGES